MQRGMKKRVNGYTCVCEEITDIEEMIDNEDGSRDVHSSFEKCTVCLSIPCVTNFHFYESLNLR